MPWSWERRQGGFGALGTPRGRQPATLTSPPGGPCASPSAGDPMPCERHTPPSLGQLSADQSPTGATGRRWSPRVPAAPVPGSQQPHVLGRSARLRPGGLLPGIRPLPHPPRGGPCWCRKLSVGREGRPPQTPGHAGGGCRGPLLCGVAPKARSQDVGTESHWRVVVAARCHGQERAAGTPLGP